MRDVDDDICDSLERLTDPAGGTPPDFLWRDLVARRRRRRVRHGALAALPLVLVAVLGAGLFDAQDPDSGRSDVAAGDREAPTGESVVEIDSYEELQDHLESVREVVPEAVLPEVVVPIRPPDGWTLESGGASFPLDNSGGSIGFDYIDRSSSRQPLPAVYVNTTTLPEPEACTTTDQTLELKRVMTGRGYVACIVGTPESVDEWADVKWTTIARGVHR